jgi:glutaredoxin 3
MDANAGETDGAHESLFPQVTVYTGDDCHWCERAKQYLTQRGVPFTEQNLENDEALQMEVMKLSGQRHVPVITVGSRTIVGFQRRELEAELDALLEPSP